MNHSSSSTQTSAQDLAQVAALIEQFRDRPGALLPLLHGVQEALGYIPPDVLPLIARALNLSRAEVFGVVSYYHHFRSAPPGRRVLQICRAEACQSMGAEALLAHARSTLGCSEAALTSACGSHTVEAAYCLGLCALSPALSLDGQPYARMTPARLDALLATADVPESLDLLARAGATA
ncbi:MAG: formate dehydrogenase subunit gamma [Leptothrix sp. (in: b-proteobacteria)]